MWEGEKNTRNSPSLEKSVFLAFQWEQKWDLLRPFSATVSTQLGFVGNNI